MKKRNHSFLGGGEKSTDSEKHTMQHTKKYLSIDPSLISSNIFYRCGGDLVNLVVTPFIFQSNIFIFLPREKEKVAALWRTKKKEEEGGERSLHSSCRCVLACCWHKEKRGEWKEKRKYILPWLCAHFIYTHTHTSFLRAYFVTRVPCGCFKLTTS